MVGRGSVRCRGSWLHLVTRQGPSKTTNLLWAPIKRPLTRRARHRTEPRPTILKCRLLPFVASGGNPAFDRPLTTDHRPLAPRPRAMGQHFMDGRARLRPMPGLVAAFG